MTDVGTDAATGAQALLARAERAVFSGPPGDAVPLLEQVRAAAGPEADRAGWLLGVALIGTGRYGSALAVLHPLVAAGGDPDAAPSRRAAAALAGAAAAGAHRQLGRHVAAREADTEALALAAGTREPLFDALLGLAADAVGLQEGEEAARRLAEAAAVLDGAPPDRWRPRVRLDRVGAEIALLAGRPDDAAVLAGRAVEAARAAGGQRHVAKALLVLGLTQVSAGSAGAAATLREAAELARRLGALPLVWPARALLGALLAEGDPAGSAACLAEARAAVETVAADLPPGVRATWLTRPEVAALRGAGGATRPGEPGHPPG